MHADRHEAPQSGALLLLPCARAGLVAFFLVAGAAQAASCAPPDEGNQPYHRAAVRVKYLPEIERWSAQLMQRGASVQYVLLLEQTLRTGGRCYWTLEVRADGKVQHRFYVSPDGASVLAEGAKGPVPLSDWRSAISDAKPKQSP